MIYSLGYKASVRQVANMKQFKMYLLDRTSYSTSMLIRHCGGSNLHDDWFEYKTK